MDGRRQRGGVLHRRRRRCVAGLALLGAAFSGAQFYHARLDHGLRLSNRADATVAHVGYCQRARRLRVRDHDHVLLGGVARALHVQPHVQSDPCAGRSLDVPIDRRLLRCAGGGPMVGPRYAHRGGAVAPRLHGPVGGRTVLRAGRPAANLGRDPGHAPGGQGRGGHQRADPRWDVHSRPPPGGGPGHRRLGGRPLELGHGARRVHRLRLASAAARALRPVLRRLFPVGARGDDA
mmetsp:Transcript_74994/g.229468  ORF Transcript_74994/g.229468 Transcript_74994/m.229468 type:complete len:235 (-) Transcript_74994:464-1168(-)